MDDCFAILDAHGKFEVDTTTSHDDDLLLPMGNTLANTVAIAQAEVAAAEQAKISEEEFATVQATCLANVQEWIHHHLLQPLFCLIQWGSQVWIFTYTRMLIRRIVDKRCASKFLIASRILYSSLRQCFFIVLAGFGLRLVFASRFVTVLVTALWIGFNASWLYKLPDMAVPTSEFELFVTRFDGSDFAWWSSHMLDALTCLGQALPLQGKDARPKSMSNSAWEDLDALAQSMIMLSLVEPSSETVVCTSTEVRQLEQVAGSCETQLVVHGLYPSVDSSAARQKSSDTETMTCMDDKHDDALRSFMDMPLPMSDNLSHGTSCVDVIARETGACEPYMAMLIDMELVDEPDFREPEMDVLFYDASDMFEDDSVLQTPMYDHGESAMIADSALDLDVLSQELLSVGVMSTRLAYEGIMHGGEQEVDTLLHAWLDAMSGSDARTILGTGASLIEHEISTRLSLLR
ncbi:hypothetical protein L7F22_059351 [Adiantum nelumboides]|nr:hypothetical protein [Adiantum nelumboides]